MTTRFAVLGAGNGGQAIAAYLTLKGFDASLYDRYEGAIAPVRERGGVRLTGQVTGFARIGCVTTDIARAVEGRSVLLVVVPAFAHAYILRAVAPHLTDGQIVALTPGATGGALEARRILTELGVADRVLLAETESLFYACRLTAPAQVKINAVKKRLALAALPGSQTGAVLDAMRGAFPQLEAAPNVLHTSLHNANPIVHPPLSLLNLTYCERMAGALDFYSESAQPSAVRLVERVDAERVAVASALGVQAQPFGQWIERVYGVRAESSLDLFRILGAEIYAGIPGPNGPQARYVSEDIPMGLVPMAALGRAAGVDTPVMDLLIGLGSVLAGVDFGREGRTLARLGLAGLNAPQILRSV